jgi:hypothetical protein
MASALFFLGQIEGMRVRGELSPFHRVERKANGLPVIHASKKRKFNKYALDLMPAHESIFEHHLEAIDEAILDNDGGKFFSTIRGLSLLKTKDGKPLDLNTIILPGRCQYTERNLLSFFAEDGDLDGYHRVRELGVMPTSEVFTAAMRAHKPLTIYDYIKEGGFTPDILNKKDHAGETPLSVWAAGAGFIMPDAGMHVKTLGETLLAMGADVNKPVSYKGERVTPLDIARRYKAYPEIRDLLERSGAKTFAELSMIKRA